MDKKKFKGKIEFYQDKISFRLLKFSQKTRFNLKLLKNLKLGVGRLLEIKDLDKCKKPNELDIKISSFVFYDLIFFEEFTKLNNSFTRLKRICGDRILEVNKRLDDWVLKANERPLQLGNFNLGFYDFSKLKGIKYFKDAQVYVLHISPSIAVLSIMVEITDVLNDKFQNIISSEPLPIFKITRFNLKQGFVGWESRPGSFRRRFEINELFDSVQSEMIDIRKKYLDFGNYSVLSFPALQIFRIPNSLESLFESEAKKKYSNFFNSIGIDIASSFHEQSEKWFIIGNNIRSDESLGYLVITSEEDYKKTKQSSYSQLNVELNFYANEFSSILALNSYLSIMHKKILMIRNYINPLLLKKRDLLNRLKRAYKILNDISAMDYRLERISMEIENPKLVFHSFIGVEDVKRKFNKIEHILKDELINRFKYLLNDSKNYLEFIKASFRDYLSFKTMHYNYKIQLRILLLTIFIIILSIILLVPANDRNEFFLKMFDIIKNIVTNFIS